MVTGPTDEIPLVDEVDRDDAPEPHRRDVGQEAAEVDAAQCVVGDHLREARQSPQQGGRTAVGGRQRLGEPEVQPGQYGDQDDEDDPERQGVPEVLGDEPARERADGVGHAGRRVDVPEVSRSLVARRHVGDRTHGEGDRRLDQAAQQQERRQEHEVAQRQRARDAHITGDGGRCRGEDDRTSAETVGQRAEHRIADELPERVEHQQQPDDGRTRGQAGVGREVAVGRAHQHRDEQGRHHRVAEVARRHRREERCDPAARRLDAHGPCPGVAGRVATSCGDRGRDTMIWAMPIPRTTAVRSRSVRGSSSK